MVPFHSQHSALVPTENFLLNLTMSAVDISIGIVTT